MDKGGCPILLNKLNFWVVKNDDWFQLLSGMFWPSLRHQA